MIGTILNWNVYYKGSTRKKILLQERSKSKIRVEKMYLTMEDEIASREIDEHRT
jgi:hypothetical protein